MDDLTPRHEPCYIGNRHASPLADGREFWTQDRINAAAALERTAQDLEAIARVLRDINRARESRR